MNHYKIARILPIHIASGKDGMLDDFYSSDKHPDEMSYEEMVYQLYQMEFALSLGWSIEMRSLGHEVYDIFMGKLIQERWAEEHGLENWEREHQGIILRQIEFYKPDILWIHALSKIPILLRLNLKQYFPFIKSIIGFAVDDPKYDNMKDLDLILCDSDSVYEKAKNAGINAEILYNGFDETILDKIDPIGFDQNARPFDFTFVGSSGFKMGNRYRKRYWTLVELSKETDIELWVFDRDSRSQIDRRNNKSNLSEVEVPQRNAEKVILILKFLVRIIRSFVYWVSNIFSARTPIFIFSKIFTQKILVFVASNLDLRGKKHFKYFSLINILYSKKVGERKKNIIVNDPMLSHGNNNLKKLEVPVSPIRSLVPDSCHEPVFGINMFHIWQRSKLTLNAYADNGYQFPSNPRMFEATGVGSCLVVENTPGIADFFEPDKEILTYQSIDECIEKVNYLLVHESERIEMAIAGQKRTLESHSYKNRCEQLNEYLQKLL